MRRVLLSVALIAVVAAAAGCDGLLSGKGEKAEARKEKEAREKAAPRGGTDPGAPTRPAALVPDPPALAAHLEMERENFAREKALYHLRRAREEARAVILSDASTRAQREQALEALYTTYRQHLVLPGGAPPRK